MTLIGRSAAACGALAHWSMRQPGPLKNRPAGRDRLRVLCLQRPAGTSVLTYKEPAVDSGSDSKPEHETKVADAGTLDTVFRALGLETLVAFEKHCANYRFTTRGRTMLATVVTVPELDGTSIELETMADEADVEAVLGDVRTQVKGRFRSWNDLFRFSGRASGEIMTRHSAVAGISVRRMTLSHDVAGDGPALVLLHSGVCDRRMWDPQWPTLIDAGYRVIRCDLRGFGETPMPDGPYNEAEDVADLLRTLGIGRAALIGSSSGGEVALQVAARWPEMITALGLLCTDSPDLVPGDALRAFGARENALLDAGDVDGAAELNVETFLGPEADDTVREKVRGMQRHAFEVQLAVTEEFPEVAAEVNLSLIKAPCLAVSGGHDFSDFREIAARLP